MEVSTICFLKYNYAQFFLLSPMMMMTMVKSKVIMIIRRRVNQCHYRLLNWGPGRLYQIHIQTASFPKISLSKHIDFEKKALGLCPGYEIVMTEFAK